MKDVPFINSGALASELSFDKWYCNQFLKSFGIPVAKSLFLTNENEFRPNEIIKKRLIAKYKNTFLYNRHQTKNWQVIYEFIVKNKSINGLKFCRI
jgi:hypothetical protein